ncbi:DUF6276 family protein [Natrinema salifodinae]|uniref:Small CPxCG-related zinc finger protein n=1 Tax=Natrinema salifodinae TaxID=1202768 RepID=A0A1I0PR27_9EURY|nr:DUF6276 family protein [Natrinema salifodinae]SEW16752.1 hypothetical protein SAMN05216285_2835 [Natrinema salifodinae]
MACSECGSSTISFSVPEEYREHAPSASELTSFCPRCLTLEPATDEDEEDGAIDTASTTDADTATTEPDFTRVSDAFPTRPERAIPLALALGLCSSLATNRSAIESLLRDVERAGTDPLLVLDRLVADPSVEPAIDLDRRRRQLEQLLY